MGQMSRRWTQRSQVCPDHSEGRAKGAQETERNYGEFTSSSRSETDTPFPAHAQVSFKDLDKQAGIMATASPQADEPHPLLACRSGELEVRRELSGDDMLSALQNRRLKVPCLLYMAA